jgi:hypothetical protein
VLGTFTGAVWARYRGERAGIGAAIGALASLASAFAGFHLRRAAGRRLNLPDPVAAMIEDGVVLTIGILASSYQSNMTEAENHV